MSDEMSNLSGLKAIERQCLTCEWLQINLDAVKKGGNTGEKSHWADWCELYPNAPLGPCGGYVGKENSR